MSQKQKICRLCLFANSNYFSIFSETLEKLKLQEKILKYLSISIKDNVLICIKCVEKLENFHKYYNDVHQKIIIPLDQVIENDNDFQESSEDSVKQESNIGSTFNEGVSGLLKLEGIQSEYFEIVQDQIDENQSLVVNENDLRYIILLEPPKQTPITESKEDSEIINCEEISQSTPIDPNKTYLKESHSRKSTNLVKDVNEPEDEIDEFDDDEEEEDDGESVAPKEVDEVTKPNNRNLDSNDFPRELIVDGKLAVKGKELTKLISKFYRLECDLCKPKENYPKIFKKLSNLITHYKNEHKLKGYVICCGVKYVKIRNMALHMARHIQPEAFRCPECKKFLTCPKILQYHIQNHLPEEKRPLACPEPGCLRRFSYQSALVTHSISHIHESERVSWCCEECGKVFSSSGRLSTHVNMAHTKNFEYICHICAKNFSCKSNLSYHLQTHEPYSHQLACKECGKFLKNKLCLRKHMALHSSIRHSCNLCDYSAINKQCLRNHIRVQHSDLKPFACEVCGKSFKLKNTLVNHKVQHTGIKRYSCEFCVRTFASSGNYYSHRKRMHSQALAEFLKNKEKLDEERRHEALRLKRTSTPKEKSLLFFGQF